MYYIEYEMSGEQVDIACGLKKACFLHFLSQIYILLLLLVLSRHYIKWHRIKYIIDNSISSSFDDNYSTVNELIWNNQILIHPTEE